MPIEVELTLSNGLAVYCRQRAVDRGQVDHLFPECLSSKVPSSRTKIASANPYPRMRGAARQVGSLGKRWKLDAMNTMSQHGSRTLPTLRLRQT